MDLIYWRITFFCLIPTGIFFLVQSIRLIRKSLNSTVILEMPFLQKAAAFTVAKDGYFFIWQKGDLMKRAPIDQFRPYIVKESNNEPLKLNTSLMRPRVNNFSTGRIQLYTFNAPQGNYRLELREGTSVSKIESLLAKLVPLGNIDLAKYAIEIRTSQSPGMLFLGIPMILLGAFGVLGGLVLGVLADQIVK